MNRDRKKKQKEPYNKGTNNKGKNGMNNVRWKKGKFKGNGNNGLSDTRGNKRNNNSYGFSNRNSSVKFRVTLDGSGDYQKGRGRNNNNNKRNNNRRNNRRPEKKRAPPVMKPQPRSEADLDADLESYRQKAPKKPVTADDLDADMDAYNSKRKQPKDDNAEGDDIAGGDEK